MIRDNPRMTDWKTSGVFVDGIEIETFAEEGHSIGAWGEGLGVAYGADRPEAVGILVAVVLEGKVDNS
jgi:hypothetical protein